MTTVKDIYNFIDSFAPFDSAMDFDNAGILAGNENAAVTKAVVALDITPDVVDEASKIGAELIISHHPVIFHPLKKLSSNSVPYMLAQKSITAICAHTNLDLSEKGVNTELARALNLQNIRLIENEALAIGNLNHTMNAEEFARLVKDNLNCAGLRYTTAKNNIKRVAVSSGAGGDNIYLALSLKADALVTGEIKHNFILDAVNNGLMIVDAGHYRTEDVVIEPLIKLLSEEFKEISFYKSLSFTDTVKYLS